MTGLATFGYLHPGHWAAVFGRSHSDLLIHDLMGAQRLVSHRFGDLGLEVGANRIVAGRNDLARTVLDQSEAEWLFMVDSDMGFAPDTLERLIECGQPVVGALCFAQKNDGTGEFNARRYRPMPTAYRMAQTDTELGFVSMLDYPADELIEVDGTGAACVLIHRDVLAKVRAEHGDHWFDTVEVPGGRDGTTIFGEDLSFCLRVKAAGFPLHVHTGIKTTHDKGGIFLDEVTFRQAQARG